MTADQQPTVFLVDDDEPVRQAVSLLLRSAGLPCETFASGDEFLAAFDPARPGCLVVDMRMPGMSGLDLQARLQEAGHAIPVIVITGHGDVPAAVRALKQGAVDFIEKPFNEQILLDAVNRALARDRESRSHRHDLERCRERLDALTEREREVMNLVVDGQPNKIIADRLALSVKTVEYHRGNVMAKLQVESVADLVKLVLKAGDRAP
jgi:FixJ family two-component response regulator